MHIVQNERFETTVEYASFNESKYTIMQTKHFVMNDSNSMLCYFFFQGISAWQHPVIVLKDVPYEDLQGIVEFIYHGEVSVDKECLSSFLKTAQTLRVKGLTEETSSSIKSSTTATSFSANQTGSSAGRSHSRKSSKPKRSLPFATNSDLATKKKAHLEELIPKVR